MGLADLADMAEKNNGNWRSSGAGLRWLIKNYICKATDAPEEQAPEVPKPKCPRCGASDGRGAMLEGERVMPCPDCATPEYAAELNRKEDERIERRKAKQATKPAGEIIDLQPNRDLAAEAV